MSVDGSVEDLAISDGEAYAIVDVSGSGAAGARLMHSPVSADEWTVLGAAGDVSVGLWVQGSNVLVQSGVGNGIGSDLLVSYDSGASFTSYPSPSPGLGCQYAEPEPPVVWAHCATGTESGVWRSTDNGADFTSAEPSGTLSLANSAAFAAASSDTAVVGYQQLYRTEDDGQAYAKVGPSEVTAWAYLGFTDDTHGIGLGYVGQVSRRPTSACITRPTAARATTSSRSREVRARGAWLAARGGLRPTVSRRSERRQAASAHGSARSSWVASASSTSSRAGGPISWTAVGRPSSPWYSGSAIAGWPVTLTIAVNGVNAADRRYLTIGSRPSPSISPIATGRPPSAGVSTAS